ncbi:MAG: hypothetical protein ABIV13_00785 [Fimbriimonadales bacterium]
MYMVVSHWKPLPGKESEFEEKGMKARAMLKGVDGLTFSEAIRSGDEIVVVHAYQDYDTYQRLVEAEDGEVAQMMAEVGIEASGEWLGSEKGETIER